MNGKHAQSGSGSHDEAQAPQGGASGFAAATPQAGREADRSRLDSYLINGTSSRDRNELAIIPCRCGCWACSDCGPVYWAKLRFRITPHLHLFKRPRLLTLTLDRKQFESGEAAYEAVRERIRVLLRLAGFKKALSVLAFHPNGPDWPHWHILVDLADCGRRVDRKRLWRLWRDEWGCGGLDLNVKRHAGDALKAANYAISYCQHQAGVVPDWVLQLYRTPRAYELYGELRAALRRPKPAAVTDAELPESLVPEPDESTLPPEAQKPAGKPHRSKRTVAERLEDCGQGSTVLHKQCHGSQTTYRFMTRLSVTPGQLALAEHLGKATGVDIRHESRDLPNGTSVLEVSVPLGPHDVPKEQTKKLERLASAIARERAAKRSKPSQQEGSDAPF